QRLEAGVGSVTVLFEPFDLLAGYAETLARRSLRGSEVGAEVEEFVLDPLQNPRRVAERGRPADQRIQLVDFAHGVDPGIRFRYARAVAEARLAAIAAACIDPRQSNWFVAFAAHTVSSRAGDGHVKPIAIPCRWE